MPPRRSNREANHDARRVLLRPWASPTGWAFLSVVLSFLGFVFAVVDAQRALHGDKGLIQKITNMVFAIAVLSLVLNLLLLGLHVIRAFEVMTHTLSPVQATFLLRTVTLTPRNAPRSPTLGHFLPSTGYQFTNKFREDWVTYVKIFLLVTNLAMAVRKLNKAHEEYRPWLHPKGLAISDARWNLGCVGLLLFITLYLVGLDMFKLVLRVRMENRKKREGAATGRRSSASSERAVGSRPHSD